MNINTIENQMVLGDYPVIPRPPQHHTDPVSAQEAADLLTLDDMSRDWDLHCLIENLPATELEVVMRMLRVQVARELQS